MEKLQLTDKEWEALDFLKAVGEIRYGRKLEAYPIYAHSRLAIFGNLRKKGLVYQQDKYWKLTPKGKKTLK